MNLRHSSDNLRSNSLSYNDNGAFQKYQNRKIYEDRSTSLEGIIESPQLIPPKKLYHSNADEFSSQSNLIESTSNEDFEKRYKI